jgi:predicted nucleic acid-binding Zn ribbon protein
MSTAVDMLKFNPKFIPARGAPKLKAKDRILAQWRGINTKPEEQARQLNAKKAGDVMPKVLTGLRMDARRAEAEIVRVWNHLIDPLITAHAQPTGINKGTLFVTVDSNPWLDEIVRYRRKEILDRLQHSFGKEMITRISFRVG